MTRRTKSLMIAMFVSTGVARAEPPGDIQCKGKRYIVPGLCMKACPANPGDGEVDKCHLVPTCKPIANDQNLRSAYNQGVLGTGMGPLERGLPEKLAKRTVVALLINVHYKPYNAGQFDIEIGTSGGQDRWASIERGSTDGTSKPRLVVANDLFFLTPGFIGSTIGHELVHETQFRRTYKTMLTGINDAVSAFRELEASMWELGEASSPGMPDNVFRSCVQDTERAEAEQTRICRAWEVRKAIADIRDSPRSYIGPLERWINEDPWVKQTWLPKNPEWKTAEPGQPPDKCN